MAGSAWTPLPSVAWTCPLVGGAPTCSFSQPGDSSTDLGAAFGKGRVSPTTVEKPAGAVALS